MPAELPRFLAAALLIVSASWLTPPAFSQPAGANAARVAFLGLERVVGEYAVVFYSAGAEAEGRFYADEVAAAVRWYQGMLGSPGLVTMAVLTREDYLLATRIPYPSPHVETATGFIIVADRVESHPGFDLWDLDGRALNAAWTLHEIGHVIARDLGISSGNAWIDELAASIVMAGYIRAERTEFLGFQSGMPPRFAAAGRYQTLAQFDQLYFAMGQFDYLWFHFHIARIADYFITGPDSLAAVVDGFRREFPIEARRGAESAAETLARLERIRPGAAAFVAALGIAN